MPYIEQQFQAKLLIVDDEPLIRTSMMQMLSEIGFSVRSAEDGLTALAEIRNEVPDIILSDLNMPGMSGFEFLSVVRQRLPSIRVIAMSGAFSGDEVPSGVAADAFFPKGSGVRCLLKIVEGLGWPDRMCANLLADPSTPLSIETNGNGGLGRVLSRSPVRSACGLSKSLSGVRSAWFERRSACIAGIRFATPWWNQLTLELGRRLADLRARLSRPVRRSCLTEN